MERLFRSRMEYVSAPRREGCFLCEAVASEDAAAHLVVGRSDNALVVLNKYPYNAGHLVVAPNRHVAEIDEMDLDEQIETLKLMSASLKALRETMKPDAFNLGANLGEVAGAGLPGHFHWHVVPRWSGDTNFMPVTAGAKVIPESLEDTFRKLSAAFRA
jgi:ATP adenylyltransferase